MAAKAQKQNPKVKVAKAVEKKKKKVQVSKVKVYINSTYNNTIVTITDYEGNVLVQSSPGIVGFTGSKKSTAYAATKAAEDAVLTAQKYGVSSVFRQTSIWLHLWPSSMDLSMLYLREGMKKKVHS